jgi:hypothetical protein
MLSLPAIVSVPPFCVKLSALLEKVIVAPDAMSNVPLFVTLSSNCVEVFTFTVPKLFSSVSPTTSVIVVGLPVADIVSTPLLVSVLPSNVAVVDVAPVTMIVPALLAEAKKSRNGTPDCVGWNISV